MGGKKKGDAPAPLERVEETPAAVVPAPMASKKMEAQPVRTTFGGAEEQAGALFSSRAPGMAQAAQLAKKYLLGQ